MDLKTYQQGLARLIMGGEPNADDPAYLQRLVGTAGLNTLREVVAFRCGYDLERFCFYTVNWLRRLGRFEDDIAHLVRLGSFSTYLEEAGLQFLQMLADDRDPVVAAMARFEIALHEIRVDSRKVRIVDWPCDPRPLIASLVDCSKGPPLSPAGRYRMTVSWGLPGGFHCERLAMSPPRDAVSSLASLGHRRFE